jgi:membrane protease YdiL (CAAX protease family)
MKNIFVNSETGLLRAGWRIFIFVVIFSAITIGAMKGVRAILGSLPKLSVLQFSILGVTATLAVFLARRYLDKQSFTSLGLSVDRYAVLDVVSGIINSALVMATVFFVMLWSGLIEFHGFSWWTDGIGVDVSFQIAVLPVVLAVAYKLTIVAWWEELVFRGYFFQNLVAGTGLMWAIIISSLVFGLTHMMNPEGTILGGIMIALLTPQLIYAYLKTGQLWLPMGLHLGWNFFQASIFGFAASGQESPSMISQSPVGPEWLSGGAFGAEGSVLIIPVSILSYVLVHYWVRATRQPGQQMFEIMAKDG